MKLSIANIIDWSFYSSANLGGSGWRRETRVDWIDLRHLYYHIILIATILRILKYDTIFGSSSIVIQDDIHIIHMISLMHTIALFVISFEVAVLLYLKQVIFVLTKLILLWISHILQMPFWLLSRLLGMLHLIWYAIVGSITATSRVTSTSLRLRCFSG